MYIKKIYRFRSNVYIIYCIQQPYSTHPQCICQDTFAKELHAIASPALFPSAIAKFCAWNIKSQISGEGASLTNPEKTGSRGRWMKQIGIYIYMIYGCEDNNSFCSTFWNAFGWVHNVVFLGGKYVSLRTQTELPVGKLWSLIYIYIYILHLKQTKGWMHYACMWIDR